MPRSRVTFFKLTQPTRAPLTRSIGRSAARNASRPRHFHAGAAQSAPTAPIPQPPAKANRRRASRIAWPPRQVPRPANRCRAPASRFPSPASLFHSRTKFTRLARAPTWVVRKPASFARKSFRDKCRAQSVARKAQAPCARPILGCAQSKTTCAQRFEPCAQAKKPCAPSSALRAPGWGLHALLVPPQAPSTSSAARPSKPLRRTLNLRACSHPCHHAPSARCACSPGAMARRRKPR